MHSFVPAGAQTFQSSKLRVVPALTILNTKLVGRYARCDCRSCDITYGDMYGTRRKYCRLERDKTRDIASPLARRDHRKSKFGLRHGIKLIELYAMTKSEF